MAYLTLETFKERSIIPPEDVDYVELRRPNFVLRRLEHWTSLIDARLRKRYAAPFAPEPHTPALILGWLTSIVTPEVYEARGWDPSDPANRSILDARADALAALKEAADGEVGLYDLPLRQDNPASAIVNGGPLGYTEQDPYTWTDRQVEAVRGR